MFLLRLVKNKTVQALDPEYTGTDLVETFRRRPGHKIDNILFNPARSCYFGVKSDSKLLLQA